MSKTNSVITAFIMLIFLWEEEAFSSHIQVSTLDFMHILHQIQNVAFKLAFVGEGGEVAG